MMTDSDQESTSNTEELISGVYRLDEISPLRSPGSPKLSRAEQVMSQVSSVGSQVEWYCKCSIGTCSIYVNVAYVNVVHVYV